MQSISVAPLVLLCSSVVSAWAQCDCRPPSNCPQAYLAGTIRHCRLDRGQATGVCCPPPSSPSRGYPLFKSGSFSTCAQSGTSFRQSPAGGFNSGRRRNPHRSSSFRSHGHGRGSQGGTGTGGPVFGGTSARLSHRQLGISPDVGFGRLRTVHNVGQSGSFGAPAPSSGYLPPYPQYPVGPCIPLVLCPPLVASPQALFINGCSLADGSPGTICTFSGPRLASAGRSLLAGASGLQPIASAQTFAEPALQLSASPIVLRRALGAAQQTSATAAIGRQLVNSGQAADRNSVTGVFNFNSQSTNQAQALGLAALQTLETISSMAPAGSVSPAATFGGGPQLSQASPVMPTSTIPGCTPEPPISCPNSFYRTVTGECNNLQNPRLGRSLTGFKRLLPNTFDDGIFAIRTRSVRGGTLPSARLISERVLEVFSNELRQYTLSLMQISQFIDHDFAHALIFRLPNGDGIECCQDEGQTFPTTPLHPQCIPIPIPANDPFYGRFNQRCMSLVRSLPAPPPDCVARPARPLNELTSFVDASNVYGSSEEETRFLRSFQNGLLRESALRLLPLDTRADKPCRRDTCYRAGDTRVNEQSLLTVIHTIWMREHNRIASELQARHPRWDDERVYQEARRVLIAEWQHIVYNEWLPVVIGFQYADDHGLLPLRSGFSTFYDPSIDPTMSNAFTTAAFRFGHTMVRDVYDTLDANGLITNTFNVSTTFFDPTVIANGVTEHARTMVARRSETFDTLFAAGLHEKLFTTNFLFGLDLLALNIQRGRDHGTPTYAQVVEACQLVPFVRVWADLNRLMSGDVIDRLRSVYADVRDVDLFIGGVGEFLAQGAQVRPTFQCIIGQQFFDLRYGDRFFYDNGGMAHSFSLLQLDQIRRSNWARIMCDTLGPKFQNDFRHVQPLAILSPAGQNQQVNCESLAIPRVDLGVF